jgi:hypothetical protein
VVAVGAVLVEVVELVAGEVRENLQLVAVGVGCGLVVHGGRALVHSALTEAEVVAEAGGGGRYLDPYIWYKYTREGI